VNIVLRKELKMSSETFMKAKKLSPKFEKLFGFSLAKFMHPIFGFDIIALDMKFKAMNPEYDPDECTYKGKKNAGMSEFVALRYGEEAVNLIRELM